MFIRHVYVTVIFLFNMDPIYANCVWKIRDLPETHPLLLSKTIPLQLYQPARNSIHLTGGESLEGVCNGLNNYMYSSQRDPGLIGLPSATITCQKDFTVIIGKVTVDIRSVRCHTNVQDNLKISTNQCGGNGQLMSVGFDTTLGDFELFKICYDTSNNIPLYSENVIHGNGINGRYRGSVNNFFRDTGLSVKDKFFNYIFVANVQEKQLKSLIGEHQCSLYMNSGNYMNRGHMAPKGDFIFYYFQRATYYYANVVPQWASVNSGTWEKIEIAVRNLATSIGDLRVFSGTFDFLKVKNSKGNRLLVKLGGKIFVPRYMWKLVCDGGGKCISYVVLNDPLGDVTEKLCDDISTTKLWGASSAVGGGRGACCNPRQLFQNMGLTPPATLTGNTLQCNI